MPNKVTIYPETVRVLFEHFSDTFKQNSSAPTQMCSSVCLRLWHVLPLIDRCVSAKGVGNSKILQEKNEGGKKPNYIIHLIIINFSVKKTAKELPEYF